MIDLNCAKGKGFPLVLSDGREISEQDFADVASKRVKGADYTPMQIVRMRFEDGMSYDAIGRVIGISHERVRQRIIFATKAALRLARDKHTATG